MNDHDSMEAINAAIDQYFRGDIMQEDLVSKVCQISGLNTIDHREAKDTK
jgi:hypothetical protein